MLELLEIVVLEDLLLLSQLEKIKTDASLIIIMSLVILTPLTMFNNFRLCKCKKKNA